MTLLGALLTASTPAEVLRHLAAATWPRLRTIVTRARTTGSWRRPSWRRVVRPHPAMAATAAGNRARAMTLPVQPLRTDGATPDALNGAALTLDVH